MLPIRILVFCSLAALFSNPFTGSASEPITLTLEQSVQIALEKNPEIRIAEKELAKTRASILESYAALLPVVEVTAGFQHAWDIQEQTIPNFLKPMLAPLEPVIPEFSDMPDFVKLSFGLENTLRYGLILNQPLFLGGAGIAGIHIARSAGTSAECELISKRQNLIYQTVGVFYGCLLSRELVQVQEEALIQARANLDLVEKRYEAGSASGFDLMRARVEVANLKPELITAQNDYQAALTGLRMVLGLPKETRINVQGKLLYVPDNMVTTELESLQDQAFQNRPELGILDAQKNMAAKGITLARSQFMPKLILSTDYSFMAMKNNYDFQSDDFSKGFTSALSLQMPLFSGLKNNRQLQKARLDYRITLDAEKQATDGIIAEVEMAFNKFQESREKYQASVESIELADEALRLANLMYEEGASTQLDVLNSQLALTRARLNYASALYEYQMARYELRLVTGTLTGLL